MAFDLQGALAAGYSPQEITEELAGKQNFDLQGALSSGYGYDELLPQLAKTADLSWKDALLEGAGNLPSSAGKFLGDLKKMVTSPVQTAKGLGKVLDGYETKLVKNVLPEGAAKAYLNFMGSVGENIAENEPIADTVNKDFANAYGGAENIKRTIATDPVRVLGDASSILTGAGGVLRAGGTMALKATPLVRAGGALSTAGGVVSKAGGMIDPLALGMKVARAPLAIPRAALGKLANVNPEKLAAFERAGIAPPSLGAVSDSGMVQGLEGALEQALPSMGTMQAARIRGQQGLTQAVENAAQRIAGDAPVPRDLESMGRTASESAEASKAKFQDVAGRFEDQVYRLAEQLPAQLDNTMGQIDAGAERFSPTVGADYRQSALSQLGGIVPDWSNNQLNIASLRREAQRVGERMKAAPTANTGGAAQFELKSLYNSLKQDIAASLPDAVRGKVDKYNQWYAGQKSLRNEVDNTFFRGDSEATARAILSAERGQLEKLRRVVGPQGFNQLRAAALEQISRGGGPAGNAGLASPAELLKKLGQGRQSMSGRVQDYLFGGEGQNLRAVAQALAESRLATNTSNTAGALSNLQALGWGAGGLANLPFAASAAGGIYGLGRAVTSPRAIKALGRWGQTPMQLTPSKTPAWMRKGGNAAMRSATPATSVTRGLLDLMEQEEAKKKAKTKDKK